MGVNSITFFVRSLSPDCSDYVSISSDSGRPPCGGQGHCRDDRDAQYHQAPWQMERYRVSSKYCSSRSGHEVCIKEPFQSGSGKTQHPECKCLHHYHSRDLAARSADCADYSDFTPAVPYRNDQRVDDADCSYQPGYQHLGVKEPEQPVDIPLDRALDETPDFITGHYEEQLAV